jgi:dTMP kinase
VLLDRYTYSNIAYQCAKLKEASDQLKLMKWILDLEFSHFAIPRPDLNIFLDVPFAFAENNLAKARTGNDRDYLNGSRDIHEESMAFQRNVRDIYLRVSETDNTLEVIDCSNRKGEMLGPSDIFDLIIRVFKERKLI